MTKFRRLASNLKVSFLFDELRGELLSEPTTAVQFLRSR